MGTHEDPSDGRPVIQRPAEDLTRPEDEPVESEEVRRAREDVKFRAFILQDRARRLRCSGVRG